MLGVVLVVVLSLVTTSNAVTTAQILAIRELINERLIDGGR